MSQASNKYQWCQCTQLKIYLQKTTLNQTFFLFVNKWLSKNPLLCFCAFDTDYWGERSSSIVGTGAKTLILGLEL